MRFLLVLPLLLALTACVYHIPIRQGNILSQKKVKQLKVGMTHSQVEYLLGTPLSNDPFNPKRWTYLYYYKSPGDDVSERILHLYFKHERLARIEGPKQLKGKRQTVLDVSEQASEGIKHETTNSKASTPTNPTPQKKQPRLPGPGGQP